MLAGKVALVTGAGKGIGRQIALTLAQNGADVIVNYHGSEKQAEEVVKVIRAYGRNSIALQASVADMESCENMIKQALQEFDHIDILINNAGITKDNLVAKMSVKDFEDVMDINLKGTFNTIKCLYRYFLKQKEGRIINISSVSGILGNAGQVNYAASKAGVIGLTKSVAKELARRNITVNAVAPGYIDTAMTESMSEEAKEKIIQNIPMQRIGEPKDVAEVVTFLASEKASYITGQVIVVDGGMAI